jgi:ATP-dependent DNA ligase
MTEPPILASLPTEIFSLDRVSDGNWWLEPKYDGHRVLIDYRGDIPRILNRNGRVYSAGPFKLKVPELFKGMVVDGEYLPKEVKYVAFDLLAHEIPHSDEWQGATAWRLYDPISWETRHDSLRDLVQLLNDPSFIAPAHTKLGSEIARIKTLPNVDGVVFKRPDSLYTPGRTTDWLKYKFTADLDAAITALNIDDKSNCELSVWDPLSERFFPVGKASTSGKGRVKIGTVVTVRFLKLTENLRLREPRIVDIRDDKAPQDCGVDQLIPFVPHLAEQD